MKTKILCLLTLCWFFTVQGQVPGIIGGDALVALNEADNGKYTGYGREYLRIFSKYAADGTFTDYLNDGKKYTVFLPDNIALEIFLQENVSFDDRLRNTLKYSIVSGKIAPEDFTDGQRLKTLYPLGTYMVSVSKGKVTVQDMQGNKVRIGKHFECGHIIFYPVKTFLRY